jgi:hypothetical protein
LPYGNNGDLERQICEFLLRGLGLKEHVFATCLDGTSTVRPNETQLVSESA